MYTMEKAKLGNDEFSEDPAVMRSASEAVGLPVGTSNGETAELLARKQADALDAAEGLYRRPEFGSNGAPRAKSVAETALRITRRT